MTSADCPSDQDLRAFHDGTLPVAGLDALADHLETCSHCQDALRRLDGQPDPVLAALRCAAANTRTGSGVEPVPGPGGLPQLPGYEVLAPLGEGGMGIVYKARHLKLNRLVALKLVRAGSSRSRARFQAEGEAAARLCHPNIVAVHEVGEHDGLAFLALEYVEGGTLAERLSGAPLPARTCAALVEVLARAVQHAHEHGILHRDLKPSNILLAAPPDGAPQADLGPPKLADFGLARLLSDDSGLTRTGEVMGTPAYMAPEQARGERVLGPACDVYALGAILYACLTGKPPFHGATPGETLQDVCQREPVPPGRLRPGLPRDLATICLKCLAKEADRRYPSAEVLADDLGRFLRGEPTRARPVTPLQRLALWARRRPALAAAHGLALLVLVLAAAAGTVAALWRQAEQAGSAEALAKQQAEVALGKEQAARREADQARGDLEDVLCMRRVALAYGHWRDNDVGQALQLLAECPSDRRQWEWGHVRRLCGGQWLGHTSVVNGVAFSPDGNRVASISSDGTVRVWSARTGTVEHILHGHTAGAWRVVFGPEGTHLAAVTLHGLVHVWDMRTGKEAATFRVPPLQVPLGVAFSPDGKLLAIGSESGTVRLWDVSTGKQKQQIQAVNGLIHVLTLGSGGAHLALSSNRSVRLWDVPGGRQVHRLDDHASQVLALALSRDGARLATGTFDGTVRLWDARTGQAGLTLTGPRASITALAFSPDGNTLVSAADDRSVRLWNTTTGKVERFFRGHTGPVQGVAFSPDGTRLASASADFSVRLWDVSAPEGQRLLRGHTRPVLEVAFGPGGRLASAAMDGTVRLWDVRTGRVEHVLPSLVGNGIVALSPDGTCVASVGAENTVRLWDARMGRAGPVLRGHTYLVWSVAFSPDGTLVGSAGCDGTVRLWDAADGRARHVLRGKRPEFVGVTFSPDGERIASAESNGRVRVWAVRTGKELFTLPGAAQSGPLFSPDGKVLACVTQDDNVRLWDAHDGRELRVLKGPVEWRARLAFSRDGRRLACSCRGQTLRLWDTRTGLEAVVLDAPERLHGLAFSPDGKLLAGASGDGTVHLWETVFPE